MREVSFVVKKIYLFFDFTYQLTNNPLTSIVITITFEIKQVSFKVSLGSVYLCLLVFILFVYVAIEVPTCVGTMLAPWTQANKAVFMLALSTSHMIATRYSSKRLAARFIWANFTIR